MNNKVEAAAKILTVVFLIGSIAVLVMQVRFAFPGSIFYPTTTFITLILRIAIAYWLYGRAKRETKYPWVWCLLGLAFGLVAIGVYFLIDIHKKVTYAQDVGRK